MSVSPSGKAFLCKRNILGSIPSSDSILPNLWWAKAQPVMRGKNFIWGRSTIGGAFALQARGYEFESRRLHHFTGLLYVTSYGIKSVAGGAIGSTNLRARSSVDRAVSWHGIGRRFKSCRVHQFYASLVFKGQHSGLPNLW